MTATLTSVQPRVGDLADDDLAELLAALGWAVDDLDPTLPPRVAYAGANHPILAAREHDRLSRLDYDVGRLRTLMLERDWTTIDLVWRETDRVFHARNPFPVGGVYEDPATGAAATAFGAYLRDLDLVDPPYHRDDPPGRRDGPTEHAAGGAARGRRGIRVSGTAVHILRGDDWRPAAQP